MSQIITLSEYKTAKGITDTAGDTQLGAIIPMINSFIETYCNRQFGIGNFTEQGEGIVDSQGRFFFKVKNRPISVVNSIIIKFFGTLVSLPLNPALLDLFAEDGYMYYSHAYDNLVGIIRAEWRDNFYYTLTYSGGQSVPPAVKLAAITAISDYYQMLNANKVVSGEVSQQLKSVKIGDYSESYDNVMFNKLHDVSTGAILSPTVTMLLGPYVYQGQSW